MPNNLSKPERLMYRDRLRAARYAALADSEGFTQICYELEALGVRLLGKQESLGMYRGKIEGIAKKSLVLIAMQEGPPGMFKRFQALYFIVRKARNDNMHLGAYARHATKAAIELCILLEEGLMNGEGMKVEDVMVTEVVALDPGQPVAHARQLMLMHSFSFLPVYLGDKWRLLSELSVAQYLASSSDLGEKKRFLGAPIDRASKEHGLRLPELSEEYLLKPKEDATAVLKRCSGSDAPTLWLVPDESRPGKLLGVLSPFELM